MVEEIAFVCLYQQIKWQLSNLWELHVVQDMETF